MIAAFDTTGPWVCAACGDRSGVRKQFRRAARLNHNEILPALFGELESSCDSPFSAFAMNHGPGSFTGTRVGVAFVAGLCQARGLKAATVSAWEVAASLAPPDLLRVRVVLPLVRDLWGVGVLARRGRLWVEEECAEMAPEALSQFSNEVILSPWLECPGALATPADWNPAVAVLNCALALDESQFRSPRTLEVRYLGKSQAERVFESRGN